MGGRVWDIGASGPKIYQIQNMLFEEKNEKTKKTMGLKYNTLYAWSDTVNNFKIWNT